MPTERRDLPDDWREEWLKGDARNQRESVGDIAREAGRFFVWWQTVSLVSIVVFVAALVIASAVVGLIVELT